MSEILHARIKQFDNKNKEAGVVCELTYNYKTSSMLKSGKGINDITFIKTPTSTETYVMNLAPHNYGDIDSIGYFKITHPTTGTLIHRLLLHGSSGAIYLHQMLDNDAEVYSTGVSINGIPTYLPIKKFDQDALLILEDSGVKVWELNSTPYLLGYAPSVHAVCYYNQIYYFALNQYKFKIWYSPTIYNLNTSDINDIVGGGFITLDDDLGDILKIEILYDEMFVIRQYGITKLEYIKRQYVSTIIARTNGVIYKNTISHIGTKILYMTNDGLYSFNGLKIERLKIDLSEYYSIVCSNAVGACLGNLYYLALRINFNDNQTVMCESGNYINNCILVINLDNFSYYKMRGMDVKSFFPLKTLAFEKMLMVFNSANTTSVGEIVDSSVCFGNNLTKYWKSGSLTNSKDIKLATKMTVDCASGITINLYYDGNTKQFTTTKNGVNVFNFKIRARDFKVDFTSSLADADVRNFCLDYYEY